MSAASLPRGVLSIHALPADHHDGPWDSIVTPAETKERLLGALVLRLLHGSRLAAGDVPLHGIVMLIGPPGTGKTTLGRGAAQEAARAVAARGATTFAEIDPHALPSDLLGETQRNVTRLLREVIPELAAYRPHTVVLVDEVESFAVRRSAASFETNPVDVHRATDAVLAGVDELAQRCPTVAFVVTSNFVEAVDEAFLSRADLVLHLELPDVTTRTAILALALRDLASLWPPLAHLASDAELCDELAKRCDGWDGRRLRKLPLQAIARTARTAADPTRITAADLLEAAAQPLLLPGVATGGGPAWGGSPIRG